MLSSPRALWRLLLCLGVAAAVGCSGESPDEPTGDGADEASLGKAGGSGKSGSAGQAGKAGAAGRPSSEFPVGGGGSPGAAGSAGKAPTDSTATGAGAGGLAGAAGAAGTAGSAGKETDGTNIGAGAAGMAGQASGGGAGSAGAAGQGAGGAPAGWTCDPAWYGDKTHCDCDCGVQDADCGVGQCSVAQGCADGDTEACTGVDANGVTQVGERICENGDFGECVIAQPDCINGTSQKCSGKDANGTTKVGERVCENGEYGACIVAPPDCLNGQTEPCTGQDANGTSKTGQRTCVGGKYGACVVAPPTCLNGETQACQPAQGSKGEQACVGGNWGACKAVVECSLGQVEACTVNGQQGVRGCLPDGTWSACQPQATTPKPGSKCDQPYAAVYCEAKNAKGELTGGSMTCQPQTLTWSACKVTPLVLSFDERPVSFEAGCGPLDLSGGGAGVCLDLPTARTPWLALDRNGNGRIDDGSELFGSMVTLRSGRRARNGFEALAELDANGDGKLSAEDPAWSSLVLFSDQDGSRTSSQGELVSLSAAGITSIELRFSLEERCDQRGNCERERAAFTFRDARGATRAGAVVDVWLTAR